VGNKNMFNYKKMMEDWRDWRLDAESVTEAVSTEIQSVKQLETVIKNNAKVIANGQLPVNFHSKTGIILGEKTKKGYIFYVDEIKDSINLKDIK